MCLDSFTLAKFTTIPDVLQLSATFISVFDHPWWRWLKAAEVSGFLMNLANANKSKYIILLQLVFILFLSWVPLNMPIELNIGLPGGLDCLIFPQTWLLFRPLNAVILSICSWLRHWGRNILHLLYLCSAMMLQLNCAWECQDCYTHAVKVCVLSWPV